MALYNSVPKADPLEALLATTALFFYQTQGNTHPQQQLQETSLKMLLSAATTQGINLEDQTALSTWMETQKLNDPNVFLPQLITHLETLVDDIWLCDRTPLMRN